jgi:hypothetical protein
LSRSGVVQSVAHGPLKPRILVRVQTPEPTFRVDQELETIEAGNPLPRPNFGPEYKPWGRLPGSSFESRAGANVLPRIAPVNVNTDE